ncbi:MAG: hypothetical protein AAF192_01825 [Pseudomonadota bacterium]
MTDHDVKFQASALTANELAAIERTARRLRAQALRDAWVALTGWFGGLTAGGAAPKSGRTA